MIIKPLTDQYNLFSQNIKDNKESFNGLKFAYEVVTNKKKNEENATYSKEEILKNIENKQKEIITKSLSNEKNLAKAEEKRKKKIKELMQKISSLEAKIPTISNPKELNSLLQEISILQQKLATLLSGF